MFVPQGYAPPRSLAAVSSDGVAFRLEPLGPQHNRRDHDAWMSSVDHIRATPGFPNGSWPEPMTREDNARDLRAHADDFARRRGFTYTVLDADDDVIGCVYLYPDDDGHDVHARSWVRADHAALDGDLRAAVVAWLRSAWPFSSVRYAGTAV